VGPLWDALYEAGADVVMNGHAHVYERFAPQSPDGALDEDRGIRQFTVGTGGASLTGFEEGAGIRANSEARILEWGIIRFELYDEGYSWAFLTTTREALDLGWAPCNP
jgi:hypothetical protein